MPAAALLNRLARAGVDPCSSSQRDPQPCACQAIAPLLRSMQKTRWVQRSARLSTMMIDERGIEWLELAGSKISSAAYLLVSYTAS